jgi:hypothetical protein
VVGIVGIKRNIARIALFAIIRVEGDLENVVCICVGVGKSGACRSCARKAMLEPAIVNRMNENVCIELRVDGIFSRAR